ncbi:MAG: HAMP domain-containing sensor histidine kinase [Planctomycetota bacterium]
MRFYSVRLALGVGFGLVILLFLWTTTFMIGAFKEIRLLEIHKNHLDQIQQQGHLLLATIQKQYIYQTHILFLEDSNYIPYYKMVWNALEEQLDRLKRECTALNTLQSVDGIEKTILEMHHYFEEKVIASAIQAHFSIRHHHYVQLEKGMNRVRIQIFNLNAILESHIHIATDQYHYVLKNTQSATIVMFSLALVFAIGISFAIIWRIGEPIRQLHQAFAVLGEGQWDIQIEPKGPYELQKLAGSFNKMAETLVCMKEKIRLQERMSVMGELASGVAHELNNPLGVITGYIQLLKKTSLEAQGIQDLNIIEQEVILCRSLVQGLLDLARPQSVQKQPLDLILLLQEVVERLQHSRPEPKATLVFTFPKTGSATVLGDEFSLRRLFNNLLLNAYDATGDSGDIEILLQPHQNQWMILIEDSGAGISPTIKEHLFKPFKTTKEKGTGLGLAISQSIIKEHGGSIEIIQGKRSGACFQIIIPSLKNNPDSFSEETA